MGVKKELAALFSPLLNDYVQDKFIPELTYIKKIDARYLCISFETSNFHPGTIYIDFTVGYSVTPNMSFSNTERLSALIDKEDLLVTLNTYLYQEPTLEKLRAVPLVNLHHLVKKAEQNIVKSNVTVTSDLTEHLNRIEDFFTYYNSIKDFECIAEQIPTKLMIKHDELNQIGLALWAYKNIHQDAFPKDYFNRSFITRYAREVYYQKINQSIFY